MEPEYEHETYLSTVKGPKVKIAFSSNHPLHIRFDTSKGHGSGVRDHVEYFFSVVYFLCIVPFKLERNESMIYLQRSHLQQIFCAAVHLLAFLYQSIEVLAAMKEEIYKDPQQIFIICFGIIDWLYIIWAVKAIWRNQSKFLKLAERLTVTRTVIVGGSKYHQLKCLAICAVPFVATTVDIAYIVFMEEDSPIWKRFSVSKGPLEGLPLFSIFERQSIWIQRIGQILYFSSMLANILLYNFLDGFLFGLSVAGYETSSHFAKIAKKAKRQRRHNLDAVLMKTNYWIQESLNLKLYFETINKVASGLYLFWFCSFCPWTALHLMESLPGLNTWGTVFYNCFYIAYYGIMMVLCINAKRKIDDFRDTAFEVMHQQDAFPTTSNHTMNHIDFLLKDAGFAGGHFFILSYRFIGSTVGTVVTYAFLALQFHLTPNNNESGNFSREVN